MKQPKIRYFLEASRDGLRDTPELVLASVSYGYSVIKNGKKRSTPFKISLECTVLPKHFGKKENNYRFDENVYSKHLRNYGFFNTRKIQLEASINRLATQYQSQVKLPTPNDFQHALKVDIGQISTTLKESELIVDHLQKRIDYYEKYSSANKKDSKRESTIKGYRTLLLHLQEYELVKNIKLTFDKFDESQYWDFWEVIDSIYRGEIQVDNPIRTKKRRKDVHGYAAKTIQKFQKNLLAFLKVSENEVEVKLNVSNANLVHGTTKASKSLYVSENELKLISETDVSFDDNLQAAKDFILISGLTGLRYESVVEASSVTVENYKQDAYNFSYIYIYLGKVKSEVCIPMLKPVMEIVKRNSGTLPVLPSNQKINVFIKDLYRHLNITEKVEVINTNYKGEVQSLKEPKCDVVSCHDSRRGFITNLDLLGVRRTVVSDITHPSKVNENAMHKLYNKSPLLDKAKRFVDEILKLDSEVYTF